METLVFIACVNLDDKYSGISRKVLSQYKVFLDEFDAYLIGYWGKDIKLIGRNEERIISSGNKHRRLAVISFAKEFVKNRHIKNVYVRRFPCNNFSVGMLKKLKTNGAQKILWEIPTYPYDTEKISIKAKFEIFLDKIWRKKLKKYVDRIVTFSDAKKIFGIETINTSNGIDISTTTERIVHDDGNEIHMIAVAVLNNWHGYDRVIRGLYEYYNKQVTCNVYFHLVGDGPEFENYKKTCIRTQAGK